MLASIQHYNSLHHQKVSREDLINLALWLHDDEQIYLRNRISRLLEDNPNDNYFVVNLNELGVEVPGESMLRGLDCIDEEEFTGLNKAVSSEEIYNSITNKVLELIEGDKELFWHKPWQATNIGTAATNFVSKKKYRGINSLMLNFIAPIFRGKQFESPYWLTFNQIKDLKGKLKKGSTGEMVVYFTKIYKVVQESPKIDFTTASSSKFDRFLERNESKINDSARIDVIPILKYYKVFNGEDIEGIDFEKVKRKPLSEKDKKEVAEQIIEHMPERPKLILEGEADEAYYRPSTDNVTMPKLSYFKKPEGYYSVFFHELVHSTGHKKRLDRDLGGSFGDSSYAFEELIAELGAVFLCGEAGFLFKTMKNSAAYLSSWIDGLAKHMRKDNKFFFRAASAAQAAADFILDVDKDGVPMYIIKSKKEESKPKVDKNGQYALLAPKPKANLLAVGLNYSPIIPVHDSILDKVELVNNETLKEPEKPKVVEPRREPIVQTKSNVVTPKVTPPAPVKRSVEKADNPFKTSYELLNEEHVPNELFYINNPDWAKFLGKVEKKPVQSLAITIDSGEGGGKTHSAFQFAHVMASSGYRPIIWSLEEHRDSNLSKDKQRKYFDEETQKVVSVVSEDNTLSKEENYNKILDSIKYFDVIIIDSWAKVQELNSKANFDTDFRKKFNGKLFFVIFQRTADGKMRGGSKGAFDGDIILKVEVDRADFRNNYVYNHKNRYNDYMPISDLKFSPYYQNLIDLEEKENPGQEEQGGDLYYEVLLT